METLGGLIELARKRKRWTQTDLGQRVGLDKAYISAIETGRVKWPGDHIRSLSTHLGISQVDMAVAAGLIDPPDQKDDAVPTPLDPELNELCSALGGMDLEGRRIVAALVAAMTAPRPSVGARSATQQRSRGPEDNDQWPDYHRSSGM